MGNTILTPQMIASELLMRFKNNLGFAASIDSYWEDHFAQPGKKIGDNLNLRIPVRFAVSDGAQMQEQDVEERKVNLQLNYDKHVGFSFDQRDLTLSVDKFGERYLDSAAVALANQFDSDAFQFCYQQTTQIVGTPGAIPTAIKTYAQARAKLNKSACPIDDNAFNVMSSDMNVEIVDATKGLFNQQGEVGKQYMRGRMGKAYNMTWIEDQNTPVHVVGPLGGSPIVAGAGQTGYTLLTSGWTASGLRLKKGDLFTVLVYSVNPVSGAQNADLKTLAAAADVYADSGGLASIPLVEPISAVMPYKTVSATAANATPLTIIGAANTVTPQGLVFHKNAFTKVSVPLELPDGVAFAARSYDKQTGLSMTIVKDYSIKDRKTYCRVDMLYGFAAPIKEWACRVAS